jgi:hypothetical protein
MSHILDQFVLPSTSFEPTTLSEMFALRLAQKLGEAPAARHFATLASSCPTGQLLCAYRRALRASASSDLGRRFHSELERTSQDGHYLCRPGLIAIRIERRAVAAAIFHGDHLEYTDARQLSSIRDKAVASAAGFIHWLLARFDVDSAAIESIPNGHEIQRRVLHDAICQALRERAVSIGEIPKAALLEGCGHPPLKTRAQLRNIATSVWPILEGTHAKVFIQDAAILGLHVQTERLFIIN